MSNCEQTERKRKETVELVEPPHIHLHWSGWYNLEANNPPGDIPTTSGVYQIQANGEAVCIGRAGSSQGLSSRIAQHCNPNNTSGSNLVAAGFWDPTWSNRKIRWAETSDDYYTEAVLLKDHKDKHYGQLPHFNEQG